MSKAVSKFIIVVLSIVVWLILFVSDASMGRSQSFMILSEGSNGVNITEEKDLIFYNADGIISKDEARALVTVSKTIEGLVYIVNLKQEDHGKK